MQERLEGSDGEMDGGRIDTAGMEGQRWREKEEEGMEGGNHSAISALSLGPVFITVQLL